MTLYFDPDDPQLKAKITDLHPTPGYCVFVDITGSTELKDQDLPRWAAAIYNAFANIRTFMPDGATPLKCLGDCLMFYIRRDDLRRTQQNALQLFGGLASIVDDPDPIFPEQKAAVVAGSAFELTFVRNIPDVYGKDIDLTARLLSRAGARELLMNRTFYDEVKQLFSPGAGFDEVQLITERDRWKPKGFTAEIEIFGYRRPRAGA